jgi:hypothetical protein
MNTCAPTCLQLGGNRFLRPPGGVAGGGVKIESGRMVDQILTVYCSGIITPFIIGRVTGDLWACYGLSLSRLVDELIKEVECNAPCDD